MIKKKEVEITTKNTKEQILTAYHDALDKIAKKDTNHHLEIGKKQSDEMAIVTKAVQNRNADIFADLGSLKSNLIKEIDVINQRLVDEFAKLDNVLKAIEIEQKYLDEVYGIKENASSLSALLIAQQEEKEKYDNKITEEELAFELEINNKKSHWLKEQASLEVEYRERKEFLDKEKKREEEEYKYNLEITRTKEIDAYNFKKAKLEQELTDMKADIVKREDEISSKEQYLSELEEKVVNFPTIMQGEVISAEQRIKKQLELEYKHNITLKEQIYESSKTLYEQKIKHLEEKIIEQDVLIKELNNKTTSAIEQVQSIACKALDTSSGRAIFYPNDIKAQEKTS
ncbi:hypothetical protein SZ25_00750 [Candidatus Arcanobacter lacustris]|uniref:Uncharacterized protein n=1 Tax=Candidatus Arcanibacter lacustris TaxID=1607817 RepID=A0A0F5MQ25_9RICK|nr:hypothetical protein SZ25_00750 [Candidatus Arcanobacter lacustris]